MVGLNKVRAYMDSPNNGKQRCPNSNLSLFTLQKKGVVDNSVL